MSAYEPPIETVPEFDVLLFRQDDTPLTIGTASKLFLRFPNAQGEENLAKTNVSGLLTANGGIKTASIEPINPALTGAIVIGSTITAPSGSVKIGNTLPNTFVDIANMTLFGGVLRFNGTGSITNSGSSNAMSFAPNTQSGNIDIAAAQTTGSLSIGNASRSAASGSLGVINIATGTATGSGGTGCVLNIGTGARTINSDINIGTGLRDSTSHFNIGYCATTGVNTGVLHLQDGDQNSANIHIGNGTTNTGNIQIGNGASNAGNCNILTGASNSGDISISTGATSTGDVFIGNNANAAGVLNLSSRNINIGTNSATNSVIYLNNALQPNYSGTQPTTIGATAIGYQLLSSDIAPFVTPGGTPADLHSVAIGNGVWFVEGTWSMNYTVAGASNAWVRIGLNTVSATISSSRSVDYNVSTITGDILFKVDSIFTISGGSSTMYLIGGSGGGTKATTYANIRLTRLA